MALYMSYTLNCLFGEDIIAIQMNSLFVVGHTGVLGTSCDDSIGCCELDSVSSCTA